MESVIYGVRIDPPTHEIAKAFGSSEWPLRLEGGQGTTYRSGGIVLKPSVNDEHSIWEAEVFATTEDYEEVRLAQPIKSDQNKWVCGGYVAWSFLEGTPVEGRYEEKLVASRKFHELIKDLAIPAGFSKPSTSWAVANMIAWQEYEHDYDGGFMELIDQITPKLRNLESGRQLVHGDISGNFLLSENLRPAIIDFSPAWAPNGFAEGIMLADAIAWEDAGAEELDAFKSIPNIDQGAWRGVLRRIVEQAEHIKWFGKDGTAALTDARMFQKVIDYFADNY